MSQVSIIIPTLNEASILTQTLRQLTVLDPPPAEVLVVDGGSHDETVAIAHLAGAQVLICDRSGRSVQMNHAATLAKGNILCFLHADTQVPDDLIAVIERTLADQTVACGGFISLMRAQPPPAGESHCTTTSKPTTRRCYLDHTYSLKDCACCLAIR